MEHHYCELLKACRLLVKSRHGGTQVDFWRSVGLIEAAMQRLAEHPASDNFDCKTVTLL